MCTCYSGDYIAGDDIHTEIRRHIQLWNQNRSSTLEESEIDD